MDITEKPFYNGKQHPDAFPYTDKGSAHLDDLRGKRMSPTVLTPIFDKLGIGTHEEWMTKLQGKKFYNAGLDKGVPVTYNVMHLIAKFLLMNPRVFANKGCDLACSENTCPCELASKCFGRAKYFAIKGDGAAVRRLLTACGGSQGNLAKLTDEDLVELWGVNEHLDIHCCGYGNPEFFHAVHATSLNDCGNVGDCEGDEGYAGGRFEDHYTANGPMGGFNDKGNYEQHGWWYWAIKTLSFYDVPEPPP
jgi:hypothetical protein